MSDPRPTAHLIESDDPEYRWSITVGGVYAPRLLIATDDCPSPEQARSFAAALVYAANLAEETPR